MQGRDYSDSNSLFEDYSDNGLFDEEDEEMGIDYLARGNPEPSTSSNNGHIHVSGPPIKISAKGKLPEQFRKQGVKKAILFMENGKAILLK